MLAGHTFSVHEPREGAQKPGGASVINDLDIHPATGVTSKPAGLEHLYNWHFVRDQQKIWRRRTIQGSSGTDGIDGIDDRIVKRWKGEEISGSQPAGPVCNLVWGDYRTHAMSSHVFVACCLVVQLACAMPATVGMSNAANPGLLYPVMGLGTAGGSKDLGYAQYPEVRHL